MYGSTVSRIKATFICLRIKATFNYFGRTDVMKVKTNVPQGSRHDDWLAGCLGFNAVGWCDGAGLTSSAGASCQFRLE